MDIPSPSYNLGISGGSHASMTGQMMISIEEVLKIERPDYVLLYGDTNSTLAGALTAAKLNMRVAHVEAGLRSFNMQMPEEVNRIITDRLSKVLFCPTSSAMLNLQMEGFPHLNELIIHSGDVMQDAAIYYSKISASRSDVLNRLQIGEFVLATLHRQENTDNTLRLRNIIEALNEINTKTEVVMPLHPRTRKLIESLAIKVNFRMIQPVGYFDMIELLKKCSAVLTDSGGLQKEAYFFGKFCLTMRDETEWTELIDGGYNTLCGAEKVRILSNFELLPTCVADFSVQLYGGGKASEIIAMTLQD